MKDAEPNQQRELHEILQAIERRVRRLTVAVIMLTVVVILMVLALFLLAAAVFGSLVNYFSFDPLLFGGVSAGCALLGFVFGCFACALVGFGFGWFARKRT